MHFGNLRKTFFWPHFNTFARGSPNNIFPEVLLIWTKRFRKTIKCNSVTHRAGSSFIPMAYLKQLCYKTIKLYMYMYKKYESSGPCRFTNMNSEIGILEIHLWPPPIYATSRSRLKKKTCGSRGPPRNHSCNSWTK